MSLEGGKRGMRCPVKSQGKAWLVALSELLGNQRSLMILFNNQSFAPNKFYCFIVSYILLFLAYFSCLSFTFRKLEEREMLEVGFATSLICFIDYLGYWQATVF
jgi:hypothetical protein